MIRIEIPGELRGKGRPRFDRRSGRAYTDAKTESMEAWVKLCAVQVHRGPPMEGALGIDVEIGVGIPASWSRRKRADALAGALLPTGKPDIDNAAKLVCDALNKLVWKDDSQIVEAHITRRYAEAPQTVITVRRLP
jgi:Holliday junction resolvase RusA-like endonuclease